MMAWRQGAAVPMSAHQLLLLLIGAQELAEVAAGPARPTKAQKDLMEMGLSMFLHYSVNPWLNIEHNCVNTDPQCIPVIYFNPTNLSTDQWVEAAVAMGAGEICLTAHHEGGFSLWDTKYTNYSVMYSPYGRDIVADFVSSCKKYGVKPCYYMGPNANGYLANKLKYSAEAFIQAQLGMLRELLTKYGKDYVSRLWWDHYSSSSGCGGLAPCPEGSFPAAWPRFVKLVRELSPSTIICPGPDCDGHGQETGLGSYPAWYPCTPFMSHDTPMECHGHLPSSRLTGFHPYEACVTMHNGWFCKGSGEEKTNVWWTPKQLWDHYMGSVGIGWVNTINAPPGTTGQIPPPLVKTMTAFGNALRVLLRPIAPVAQAKDAVLHCGSNSTATLLELDLGSAMEFNMIMTREDLSQGQRVAAYALEYYDSIIKDWKTFSALPKGNVTGVGIHGVSIGPRIIDFVPRTVASKVRLRCKISLAHDGKGYISSFSLHKGDPPTGDQEEVELLV